MNLAFVQGLGPLELTIVLVIVLLILGPKRLPAMGRSLGGGMREFKASLTKRHEDDDRPSDSDQSRSSVIAGPAQDAASKLPIVAVDERPLEGEIVPERR